MELFDSHSHYYDEAFDADRDQLLSSLPDSGVCGIINAGTDAASSLSCVRLAKQYPFAYAAAGIHPESAETSEDKDLESIIRLIDSEDKVVALGEIGLDYHYPIDRDRQKYWFENQLALSVEKNIPVIIHDREAHGDTLELLKKYRPKGVLHCFSGSAEMAEEVLGLGIYLGFTGSVTFKNNRKAARVLSITPLSRILIETDCPYMAPEPLRGRRCDSSMLRHTLGYIAGVKGLEPETAAAATAANARELFQIDRRQKI